MANFAKIRLILELLDQRDVSDEYSATGVPPIRKSGTAFPRKVYRLSAKVYRLFFRL